MSISAEITTIAVASFCGRTRSSVFAPSSLCMLPSGDLLVADELGHQLCVFDQDLNERRVVGNFGHDKGQFHYPVAIACNDQGIIAVADKWNHRIQFFDERLTHIRSVGSYGSGPGQFSEPSGVIFMGELVYVADTSNGRVVALSMEGQVVYEYMNSNPLPQFYSSAIFKSNQHYAHWLGQCSRFHSMSDQFVELGFKVGLLEYPGVVVAGPEGSIIVVDAVNTHMVQFTKELQYECILVAEAIKPTTCWYDASSETWCFGSEYGRYIVMRQRDREQVIDLGGVRCSSVVCHGSVLYVADSWNGTVTRFRVDL